jgi:nicotinamide mononucleotide transporter PnuC
MTALIFVAKGRSIGQLLTIVFSVFYGIISIKNQYYGEMITYLGMSAPMALVALISWIKNPYKNTAEVKVNSLSRKQLTLMSVSCVAVTIAFYFILRALGNASLLFSTLSVTTSFLASYLTALRSPYYALAYSANDIVLIVLWIVASMENPKYVPMIACFVMFLANDLYGFYNWRKMKKRQK